MNLDLALRRLREGNPLAAHVTAARTGTVAWAGIYPLDLASAETRPILKRMRVAALPHGAIVFRVRVIEVSDSLLAEDRWLCEDDLDSREDLVVVGEQALLEVLDRLGVPRDALEHPDEVDYPI
jgi:hypothetical protein